MFKKINLLLLALVMFFSCSGVAVAQNQIHVAIRVKSDYAPKGYWSADFINFQYGNLPQFTENPVIENSRMLVPLRQIAEALGYSVIWEPNTQTIQLNGKNIKGEDTSIQMNVGVSQAAVNSKSIPLDVSPKIINGHTMIPLRFISEAMGYFVKYHYGDIYITDYQLIEDSEIDNIYHDSKKWDSINYYIINNYPFPHLKNDGQTERGIRLGDSIEKVLQAYPRGLNYPANFTGSLWYDTWIPLPKSCGTCGLVFTFKNGILTDVYTAI